MMNSELRKDVNAQSPLAGVVLCCTSITPEQRAALANVASQMGADHRFDLTSDVTHLVVGHVDTAKYRYVAKERTDVRVVLPSFIEAVRDSWMQGGTTDVATLEEAHRAPALLGLRVCVTGFDDLEQRRYIQAKVQESGAEYHGDLTKAVTHLVAAAPKGKKYEYARQWGVKVVALLWLTDSLERGMVLDEALYDPVLPQEHLGRNAWNKAPVESVALGKRAREADQQLPAAVSESRRKLRRTLSSKLNTQTQEIWADITGGSVAAVAAQPADESGAVARAAREESSESRPATPQIPQPPPAKKDAGLPRSLNGQALFQGRLVFIHGFDERKRTILNNHLISNGASIVIAESDLENQEPSNLETGFMVVPHDKPLQLSPISAAAQSLTLVTEWWVESCLHSKTLISPAENVILKPFKKIGITGFEDMVFGSTGFSPIDLLHVSKVVRLMGGVYDEFLKPTTTILICSRPSANPEKLRYASENNTTVVWADWLWDCLREGKRLPFESSLVEVASAEADRPKQLPKPRQLTKPDGSYKESIAGSALGSFNPKTMKKPAISDSKSQQSAKQRVPKSTETHTRVEEDTPGAFVSNITTNEGSTSQPLRELPSAINSPRKRSDISAVADVEDESVAHDACHINQDILPQESETIPPASNENLNQEIAFLLAQKQASRPGPASDKDVPRQRRRLFGRAPSLNSNRSMSHASSMEGNAVNLGPSESLDDGGADLGEYQPSQALVYEDPDAQLERERMMRKVGGTLAQHSNRVEGVGFVKDEGVPGEKARRGRRSARA